MSDKRRRKGGADAGGDENGIADIWKTAVESIDDAVYVINDSFEITYYNTAFEKLCTRLGIKSKTISSDKCLESLPFHSRQIKKECQQVFSTGKEISYQDTIRFGNEDITALVRKIPHKTGGMVIAVITIIRDISTLVIAEETTRESKELSRAVIQNSPIGISVRNSVGVLVSCNEAWRKIWGATDADIEKAMAIRRDTLIFDEQDEYLGEWKEAVREIYQEGGQLHIPSVKKYIERKDKVIWVTQRFYGVKNSRGAVERVVIITEDITERKRTEQELKASEERYKLLISNIPASIFIIDSSGTITYTNEIAAQYEGLTPEQIIGTKMKEHLPPDEWEYRLKIVQQVIASKKRHHEESMTILQGQPFWHEFTIQPLIESDGTCHKVMAIAQDITERKNAELELYHSEERNRYLLEQMPSSIVIIDGKGTYTYVNQVASEKRGLKPEDMTGRKLTDFYEPLEAKAILKEIQRVIKTGEYFHTEVNIPIGKTHLWYDVHIKPFRSGNGSIENALVIANDITERRRIERALQISEEKYRMLVDTMPIGIVIVNKEGVYTYVNESVATTRHMPRDEIIGKTIWEMFPKEVAAERMDRIKKIVTTGKKLVLEDKTIINGREVWHHAIHQPYIDTDGNIIGVMIIATDISELKNAEMELKTSEERYRRLLHNVPADITLFDYDGHFLFVNDQTLQSFKLSEQDILGKTMWEMFPQKQADEQMAHIRHVIDSGEADIFELETIINNRRLWYTVNVQPYPYASDAKIYAQVIALDITQLKQAEAQLRRSEEKLKSTIASMDDLVFVLDDKSVFVDFYQPYESRELYASPDAFLGKHFKQVLPPYISTELERAIKKVKKTGNVQQFDYYLDFPSGREWFNAKVSMFRGASGEIEGMILVARNITERKKMEEELLRTQKELERRVRERTQELGEANEALQMERATLQQKNIALQEILNQIEKGKQQMSSGIQANVDRILLPILETLNEKVDKNARNYVDLLRTNLKEITAPFMNRLEKRFSRLTLREMEICNMIKNGLSCKEIASNLDISVQTVLKQRSIIRKKLNIANKKINLMSFLQSMDT